MAERRGGEKPKHNQRAMGENYIAGLQARNDPAQQMASAVDSQRTNGMARMSTAVPRSGLTVTNRAAARGRGGKAPTKAEYARAAGKYRITQ